jgi:cardiolipin synthase A/B
MTKEISPSYTYSNQVQLIKGGQDFFQTLKLKINEAQRSIYFQFYIFDDDETGRSIANDLIAAAKRNVDVYLLLDRYASGALSSAFIQEFKDAGIHFRWFTSFFKNRKFYVGRRLHHKVIVIDSDKSFVCGLNISNRYNDIDGNAAWLDWAAYAEGATSLQLEQVCKRRMKDHSPVKIKDDSFQELNDAASCAVKVCINDWVSRKSEITRSYLKIIRTATTSIHIMSPYFLPGHLFRRALKRAVQRGVKVQLVLAGNSDIVFGKYAERYMYEWLLKNKIQVYEYKPGILHGKIATADGEWTTVGSYNVNNLSAYASIELNLEIKNQPFARTVQSRLEEIIKNDCQQITMQVYKYETNLVKRFAYGSMYNFMRLMLFIFTFRKPSRE